jgi:hypothetical protein
MADGFAIYYDNSAKDKDRAFQRAATTWEEEFLSGTGYKICPGSPRTFIERAMSESDFVAAWSRLAQRAATGGLKFIEGRVFSHASKSSGQGTLEFTGSSSADGTITTPEIKALPVLPWADDAVLVLHGCRSGLPGSNGRAAAKEFASAQGVHTVGQPGYAYFSRSRCQYSTISSSSTPTFLWAYARGRNSILGSGGAMRGIDFYP